MELVLRSNCTTRIIASHCRVVHNNKIFFSVVWIVKYDQYRVTKMNDNDHLAGQLIDCKNGSIEEA